MATDKLPGINEPGLRSYAAPISVVKVKTGRKSRVRQFLEGLGIGWGDHDPRHPGGTGLPSSPPPKGGSRRETPLRFIPPSARHGNITPTQAVSEFVKSTELARNVELPPPARVLALQTSPVEPPPSTPTRLEVFDTSFPPVPRPSHDIRRQP